MKNMKRILATVLAAILLLSCVPALAEDAQKVEISFKVGDSTLMINGSPVTVQTPYVAGEGTTLVPLRVISEAFGAVVGWEDATQTITLDYSDVKITLQIGNKSATVNNHTETLAEPPALSGDYTMVPLRFISETFGAAVSYDEKTEAITVTKEAFQDGQTIQGKTDMARVGDSYYAWSMDTPQTLSMTDRSFDGVYTEFSNEADDVLFTIDIYEKDKDVTAEKILSDMKDAIKSGTLTKSEKTKDESGNDVIYVQGKNKNVTIADKVFIKDGMIYDLMVSASADNKNFSDYTKLLDSFTLSFSDKEITYDLSDVGKDGFRPFKDEKYKTSFKLPQDWFESSSENQENIHRFYPVKGETSDSISFLIYSKSEEVTAESLAKKDMESNTMFFAKKFSTITPLTDCTVGGKYPGKVYTQTVSGTAHNDQIFTDCFFEIGDYVYNISFTFDKENNDLMQAVLDSVNCEPLDKNEIGDILQNDYDAEGTYTVADGDWTMQALVSWSKNTTQPAGFTLTHNLTGSILTMEITDARSSSRSDYITALNKLDDKVLNVKGMSGYGDNKDRRDEPETIMLNNTKYSIYEYISKSDNNNSSSVCIRAYHCLRPNAKIISFYLMTEETYYGSAVQNEAEKMIATFDYDYNAGKK